MKEYDDSNAESSSSCGLIQLNVGGQMFTTQRSVLTCSRAEDSMLFAVGAGWFENRDEQEREETFIDRDGTLFGVILDWLRQSQSPERSLSIPDESAMFLAQPEALALHNVVQASSLLRSWSCIHQFAMSANRSPPTTNKMLQHELSCLEVEAQYYGLDKLVEEITKLKANFSVVPACHWLCGYEDDFELVTPQHVRQRAFGDGVFCHASTPFPAGVKSSMTIKVFNTDRFWIELDPGCCDSAVWHRPPLTELPREGDCDVVRITVDLTNTALVPSWGSPTVIVDLTVNGIEWFSGTPGDDIDGYPALFLHCFSETEDAEFLIDEAQAIEVSTLPCT
eukprot:TRINITY_DN67229_c1_g1_i13.p1 TRINITY_DN67229_c1_g1~~TRINITY_DN67229_c1_g1_i13.p1  ORF type:complete len:365 (-),score=47.93 TRINITY_DN67229_c1_g1_i13:38-1048(-)